MELDVVQVKGCYVSSSLPKALFVPAPSTYHPTKRNSLHSTSILHFKPNSRSTEGKHTRKRCLSNQKLPVEGRQHLAVQTDLYLEELCDVIEEVDVQCETDAFLERPPTPVYVPAKLGIDVETQIYPGELFDFDVEVEPVLETLVEQTLDQAMNEIIADENLYSEAKINAEVAKVDRLEEKEQKHFKETSIKEQEDAILLQDEMAQKIMACIFSQNYLSELVPQVYKKLEVEGYFDGDNPKMQEMEAFWPWLIDEVDAEIATLEASCQLLDTLIEDSVQHNPEVTANNSPTCSSQEKGKITPNEINSKVAASASTDELET